MVYVYKCESCRSLGELEQKVPVVECPLCGGSMKPEENEQDNENFDFETAGIAVGQEPPSEVDDTTIKMANDYKNIKVAKTVNIGFSGMLKSGINTGAFTLAGKKVQTGAVSTPPPLASVPTAQAPVAQTPAPQPSELDDISAQQNEKKNFFFSKKNVGASSGISQSPKRAVFNSKTQTSNHAQKTQTAIAPPSQPPPSGARGLKFKPKGAGATQSRIAPTQAEGVNTGQAQTQKSMPPQQQSVKWQTQGEGQKTQPQSPLKSSSPDIEYQKKLLEEASAKAAAKMPSAQIKQNYQKDYQADTYRESAVQISDLTDKIKREAEKIAQIKIQQAQIDLEKRIADEREKSERLAIEAEKIAQIKIQQAQIDLEKRIAEEKEKSERLAIEVERIAQEKEKYRRAQIEMEHKLEEERKRAEEEKERAKKLAEEEKERSRKLAEEVAKRAAQQATELLAAKFEKEKEESRKNAEEKARKEKEELERRVKELEDQRKNEEVLRNAVSKAIQATSLINDEDKKKEDTTFKNAIVENKDKSPESNLIGGTPSTQTKINSETEKAPNNIENKQSIGEIKTNPDDIKLKDNKKTEEATKESKIKNMEELILPRPPAEKSEEGKKKETDSSKTDDKKEEKKDLQSPQKTEEKKEEKESDKLPKEPDKNSTPSKKGQLPKYPQRKPMPGKKTQAPVNTQKKTEAKTDSSTLDTGNSKENNENKKPDDIKKQSTQIGIKPPQGLGVTHTGLIRMQRKKKTFVLSIIFSALTVFCLLLIFGIKSCAKIIQKNGSSKPKVETIKAPTQTNTSTFNRIPEEAPSALTPEFKKVGSEVKNMSFPKNKEEIEAIIKIWQDFIDKNQDMPNDPCIKKAREEIKKFEDMKSLY